MISLVKMILGGLVIIAVLALIIFPGFRGRLMTLCGGFLNLFVEDMAKTPEGAEAIYQQAIDELTNEYSRADDVYKRLCGEQASLKRKIEVFKTRLADVEAKCESLARAQRFEDAKVMASQRSELLDDLDGHTRLLAELNPRVEEARRIHTMYQNKLSDLKREKTRKINELKLHGTMKSLHDNLDELKNTSDIDKLLSAVRDHSDELRKEATGAAIVHENRTSTKVQRAEERARAERDDQYINQLMSRYNGK